MTNYKLPKPRYDRALANSGREIYITDENDSYYGTFTVRLIDTTLPRYRLTLEKLHRKYNTSKGPKFKAPAGMEDHIAAELFVELALIDWKDVGDWRPDAEDGAMMPFSKQNAIDYFTLHEIDEETGEKIYLTHWLFGRLNREAEDISNFQPPEVEGEDVEGN